MPFFIPLLLVLLLSLLFLAMSVYLAEFIGTAILLYFGNSVNAATSLEHSYAKGSGWIVTTVGWGLSVTFAVYAVGQISGGHINPAVTLGLGIVGEFEWTKTGGYFLAQLAGGITGATLAWLQYLPHWGKTADPAAKLGVFATGGAVDQKEANLVSEILGTMILVMGLMFIGSNDFADGLNPLAVGGLIVLIGMAQGGTTGYAINPARDLGPRIAHFFLPIKGKGSSNWKYAPIPVLGPLIGGGTGATLYYALFKETTDSVRIEGWICIGLAVLAIIYAIIEEYRKQDAN